MFEEHPLRTVNKVCEAVLLLARLVCYGCLANPMCLLLGGDKMPLSIMRADMPAGERTEMQNRSVAQVLEDDQKVIEVDQYMVAPQAHNVDVSDQGAVAYPGLMGAHGPAVEDGLVHLGFQTHQWNEQQSMNFLTSFMNAVRDGGGMCEDLILGNGRRATRLRVINREAMSVVRRYGGHWYPAMLRLNLEWDLAARVRKGKIRIHNMANSNKRLCVTADVNSGLLSAQEAEAAWVADKKAKFYARGLLALEAEESAERARFVQIFGADWSTATIPAAWL